MSNNRAYPSKESKIAGGVIVFCIVAFAAFVLFFMRFEEFSVGTLRFSVIVVFTVAPASMYYVFIASRKTSLFQEYVVNLYRLGLLQSLGSNNTTPGFSMDEEYIYRARLMSYILRFEGVFGPIDPALNNGFLNALKATDPSAQSIANVTNTNDLASGQIFSFSTVVPVLVATFIIGICWMMVIPPWVGLGEASNKFVPATIGVLSFASSAPLFAFLGAYFFSIQMLFRRFVTGDLRAKSYTSVSMRIVLGVIGAWVLELLFGMNVFGLNQQSNWLLVIAFVAGAFPPIVWRLIREGASSLPGVKTTIPSMDSKLPVSELDGLTVWHQARFEEEDVENTYNMANVDIVNLLVQTKIPPDRIIDWVDQAILYSVISCDDKDDFRTRKRELLKCGIRSASMLDAALTTKRQSEPDDLACEGMLGDMGIGKASMYSQSISAFSNYHLVKSWRQNSLS